jgi:hypothetical protein
MNELLKAIADWVDGFESDFEGFKKALQKELRGVEASLYRRILADILPALGVEDGKLKSGVSNLAKANMIERVFDELGDNEMKPILKRFAEKLLAISGRNAEYYLLSGQDAAKVDRIAKDVSHIRAIIGIDKKGELLNNGYLSRLGRNDLAREQIKNYLLTSIATKQNVTQFERGLRNIITTTKDVNGAIIGYWTQYAFDTYAKVREVDNLHFADELKLNYFIYQGGIIKTSRAFCIRKNGKVFSRDEALRDWPKDSTLIDQKHLASYKPLIDRGRNNCRHFLMWITDERANELKGTQ